MILLLDEYTLWYYNTDDGVWVKHEKCGWEKNLDFGPTVQAALDAIEEHTDACQAK